MHMMCRINAWLLFVVIKHFISLSSKNVNTAYIQHSSGADAPYTVSQSIPVFLSFGMKLSWPVIMSLVHGVSTVTKQGKWSYKSKKRTGHVFYMATPSRVIESGRTRLCCTLTLRHSLDYCQYVDICEC